MTHDELLTKLIHHAGLAHMNPHEYAQRYSMDSRSPWYNALRAVVEKHTPFTPEFGGGIDYCWADDRPYPCPTIQAIEKELA
jgi:hypothetical protein